MDLQVELLKLENNALKQEVQSLKDMMLHMTLRDISESTRQPTPSFEAPSHGEFDINYHGILSHGNQILEQLNNAKASLADIKTHNWSQEGKTAPTEY